MRKILILLAVGLLATGLAGCGAKPGTSDPDYAAKYKAAVEQLTRK
jgi:ABC-type glycerol-3-phosphate transport system substrate-binding protein